MPVAKKWVVGVDLGATKIAAGLVNPRNEIIKKVYVEANVAEGPTAVVERIAGCVEKLHTNLPSGECIAALGICCPGPLDHTTGMVLDPPNMTGWVNVPLQQMLEERLGLPAPIEHDAKAAALGEFHFGAGRDTNDMVYIVVGTGVGYVFDGNTDLDYDEVAPPNPINQYGRSKLAGEMLCTQICPRTYVVRTAWLFGHAPNNYVERVLKAADSEGIVRMPVDQIESPTYTVHLAEAILNLLGTGAYGVYNVTSMGSCTRATFAQFVLKCAERSEPVEILEARPKRTAKRPGRTVLDCRLYRMVTGQSLPDWQQGIRDHFARANQA